MRRHCWHCDGHGKQCADEPYCYDPGTYCKWSKEGGCEEAHGESFTCLCEASIVVCKDCDGRGYLTSPLEQLAEAAE